MVTVSRRALLSGLLALIYVRPATEVIAMTQTHRAVMGFQIERKGKDYTFFFRTCGDPDDDLVFLEYVVEELGPGDTATMICWVSYGAKNGHSPTSNRDWRYGHVPPGYQLIKQCRPLEAGKTYRVGVEASGPAGGSGGGRFRIDKSGKPVFLSDRCRKGPPPPIDT